MKSARGILLLSSLLALPLAAQNQISGGTCSASDLNGTYSLLFNGRSISSAGVFAGSLQAVGTATFDGQSTVTLSLTDNTNQAQGKSITYSGTYAVPSNCSGTIKGANGLNLTLLDWNGGKNFIVTGVDATYVYSGNGSNVQPAACATASISGPYVYDASGFTLSGTTQNGVGDESGALQFDGQGNVTASFKTTTSAQQLTASGKYTVTSACQASATLTDSSGNTNNFNFAITGAYGQSLDLIEANPQFVRSGTAHVDFFNPTQSIGNVASGAVNYTPPGSVFALYGLNLATREGEPAGVPLPTTLLTTTVTVNGEAAPLFYVNTGQIDAQMPWDIPGGTVATVIVKNGSSTSNAAAVYVPATGTPGISNYGTNRAVVINKNGNVNSATDAAAVGDEVVAYFTGGGPVNASGNLVSGKPAPSGLSPVTGNNSVTVGNATANVVYMGLTPGSIGLYQVNFIVPQLAKGTYPVVITIAGQASNAPVMTISN